MAVLMSRDMSDAIASGDYILHSYDEMEVDGILSFRQWEEEGDNGEIVQECIGPAFNGLMFALADDYYEANYKFDEEGYLINWHGYGKVMCFIDDECQRDIVGLIVHAEHCRCQDELAG